MSKKPNVIIMYADDLGYGDLGCYGAEEIKTPNIDAIACDGIRFTDAYTSSAVCTPARYSLMTGRYPFRCDRAHVLPGDAKCIIEADAYTLPMVFRDAGYRTGIVGKWHLGLSDGSAPIDWNREISLTPIDLGFDESFIFPATCDRVPCVYVDGAKVAGLDQGDPIEVSYAAENPFPQVLSAREHPELLRMQASHGHDMSIINGVGRIGWMRGGSSALWRDEDLAESFLGRAKKFVSESDQPFFLYYAFHQPHVPRLPSDRFKGSTKLGARGDVIAEMDWCVGELIAELKRLGKYDDTVIIFSSDNGPVLDDGYCDRAYELNRTHRPAGALRGGKYSRFEGGVRIPFILSWHNTVRPGISEAIIAQQDLLSSFANMLGVALPDSAAPDSINVLPALIGESPSGREEMMGESLHCGKVLRKGKWVYLEPHNATVYMEATATETGASPSPQLYNLTYDIGERCNLAWKYPAKVKELDEAIRRIMSN